MEPVVQVWQFDFGAVKAAAEGYIPVSADTRYEEAAGYGFTNAGSVTNISRDEEIGLRCTSLIPVNASFRIDVPDGNYRIGLLIGDARFETETSVRGEEGQLLLHRLHTPAGHFERYSFAVQAVDGTIILTFSGRAPRIAALEVRSVPSSSIYIAGDSTVTNQPAEMYPYAGWGQMLPLYIKPDLVVRNFALSGRSSRSFITEGVLDRIVKRLKPNDYVLIQFGHNDQKLDEARHTDPFTTYKEHLKVYIDACRERKATAVLITPVHRRHFDSEGTLIDTHGDYIAAVRQLAEEEQVPLVDLAAMSAELFARLGPEGTKSIFMWGAPGEFIRFPDGVRDDTHFQEWGAIRLAELVAQGLKQQQLEQLHMYLK
ncbi:GDSL family lipase [Paenibacillus campinasensis]|uniref:GDSL family lipase n=1 Tax=Paenibacillus campinasensis TaxID=66347 RepID=A0ABW9T2J3_9BACL|nr:GDSL-type esterase/lipase family protein [Paenibacillus campinasensis]MUG66289.1 GDSL family lipase [Paenibacillus campinasensis]